MLGDFSISLIELLIISTGYLGGIGQIPFSVTYLTISQPRFQGLCSNRQGLAFVYVVVRANHASNNLGLL